MTEDEDREKDLTRRRDALAGELRTVVAELVFAREERQKTCLHENVSSGHVYDECDDCGARF